MRRPLARSPALVGRERSPDLCSEVASARSLATPGLASLRSHGHLGRLPASLTGPPGRPKGLILRLHCNRMVGADSARDSTRSAPKPEGIEERAGGAGALPP